MKVIAVLVFLLISVVSYARDYEVSKKAGEFRVEVAIDKNPPIIGDNKMTIKIKDVAGNYITDAKVSVNYSMPPMPGMAPMNYTTVAVPKGSEYRTTMRLIMAGPWNVIITLNRAGRTSSLRFPIDVR